MSALVVVVIAVAVVVTEIILLVTDTGPNLVLVAALVVATGVSIWAARPLSAEAPRPGDGVSSNDPPPPDSPDLRAAVLRQATGGGGSRSHHAEQLRRQLSAIVDDQLLTAHGIDRAAEPERARQLIGPDLARFLADPRAVDRLTERRLDKILSDAEAL